MPLGLTVAMGAVVAGSISYFTSGHAAVVANPNCTLIVPANPLTAAGLATPYQLVATNPRAGACHETNAAQSAFVQGAIISNGQITLYNPLVVDRGTQPAAAPVAATVPAGATVALWFGFNGDNLTLRSAQGTTSLTQGVCVNGSNGSIFGQFAYCNAPAFFTAANQAIAAGQLTVPALGTARDGKPCPTVRDFSLVDQDQSDNVVTHYLASANGRIAQSNAAGRAAVGANPADLANGSDNGLLDAFVDPTLGCTPWKVPDQSSDNAPASALPLNELQAAADQKAPIAVVPLTDPMTLVNNNSSTQKANLYRAGVDQPAVGRTDNGSGATYCRNLFTNAAGIQRNFADQAMLSAGPSPDPAAASNLFTFLAMRGSASFTNLNCQNFGLKDPIAVATDAAGVVVSGTFTPGGAPVPASAGPTAAGTSAAPSAGASAGASAGPSAGTSAAPSTAPSVVATPSGRICQPNRFGCHMRHW